MPVLRTSMGQLLVNETLPEDLRDYQRVLDKKGMAELLRQLARKHTERYRDVSKHLADIGRQAASETGGFSFGLRHMAKSEIARRKQRELWSKVKKILDDDRLTDRQRNDLLVLTVGRAAEKIPDEVYQESLREENPLAFQVLSGSRGNAMNLAELRGTGLLFADHRDDVLPLPILSSYSEGYRPVEYWAGTYGARKGVMATKFSTQDAGFLCLAEGTQVCRPEGTSVPIEQLRPGDLVLGADRRGRTFPTRVRALFVHGLRRVWRYVFRAGRAAITIEATEDHRVLAAPPGGRRPYLLLPLRQVAAAGLRLVAARPRQPALVPAGVGYGEEPRRPVDRHVLLCRLVRREEVGWRPTYDIEVDHPDHLFVLANGMVVSNSKQLNQVSHRLVVVDEEDPRDDPTPRGLPVDVDDPDNEGALLAQDVGPYRKNTVLTPKILKDIRRRGHARILVRSPVVGGSPDGGVYARDVGVRERGVLPGRGEQVGLTAAQALSEPLSQAQLSAKHSGGVAGREKAVSGFQYINQLIQVPKVFRGGAAHATEDGTVERIEDAPAGGKFVWINGTRHYVGAGFNLRVRPGDTVEAGDVISDGIPQPHLIVQHKGIGEGRRYFVQAYTDAMRSAGLKVNRRNVEILARGLINHVRLTDEFGGNLPDDVVPYATLEYNYQPRAGHQELDVRRAVGKYLEKPVLHYTIGTRVRPSVIRELQQFGIRRVVVHDEPPPFQGEMIRGMYSLQHDPDVLARMYGSGIKGGLLEAVHRGRGWDESGTSFVPGLARASDFGLVGPVRQPEPGTVPDGMEESARGGARRKTAPRLVATDGLALDLPPPAAAGSDEGGSMLSRIFRGWYKSSWDQEAQRQEADALLRQAEAQFFGKSAADDNKDSSKPVAASGGANPSGGAKPAAQPAGNSHTAGATRPTSVRNPDPFRGVVRTPATMYQPYQYAPHQGEYTRGRPMMWQHDDPRQAAMFVRGGGNPNDPNSGFGGLVGSAIRFGSLLDPNAIHVLTSRSPYVRGQYQYQPFGPGQQGQGRPVPPGYLPGTGRPGENSQQQPDYGDYVTGPRTFSYDFSQSPHLPHPYSQSSHSPHQYAVPPAYLAFDLGRGHEDAVVNNSDAAVNNSNNAEAAGKKDDNQLKWHNYVSLASLPFSGVQALSSISGSGMQGTGTALNWLASSNVAKRLLGERTTARLLNAAGGLTSGGTKMLNVAGWLGKYVVNPAAIIAGLGEAGSNILEDWQEGGWDRLLSSEGKFRSENQKAIQGTADLFDLYKWRQQPGMNLLTALGIRSNHVNTGRIMLEGGAQLGVEGYNLFKDLYRALSEDQADDGAAKSKLTSESNIGKHFEAQAAVGNLIRKHQADRLRRGELASGNAVDPFAFTPALQLSEDERAKDYGPLGNVVADSLHRLFKGITRVERDSNNPEGSMNLIKNITKTVADIHTAGTTMSAQAEGIATEAEKIVMKQLHEKDIPEAERLKAKKARGESLSQQEEKFIRDVEIAKTKTPAQLVIESSKLSPTQSLTYMAMGHKMINPFSHEERKEALNPLTGGKMLEEATLVRDALAGALAEENAKGTKDTKGLRRAVNATEFIVDVLSRPAAGWDDYLTGNAVIPGTGGRTLPALNPLHWRRQFRETFGW